MLLRVRLGGILALVLLVAATTTARADVIAQYDLTGDKGTEVSDNTTYTAPGVSGQALVRGSGLTATAPAGGVGASGWSTSYAGNGGPQILLETLSQPATTVNSGYLDSNFTFAPIVATSSLVLTLSAANNTAVNGSPIASTGTFRVSDYLAAGSTTYQPITLFGTVTTTPSAVPEPTTLVLAGLATGLAGLVTHRRRRSVAH